MSGKYKKTFQYLNNIENLLIRPSTVTGCLSIYGFPFLSVIPIGIESSAIELKIGAIIAVIKKKSSIYNLHK